MQHGLQKRRDEWDADPEHTADVVAKYLQKNGNWIFAPDQSSYFQQCFFVSDNDDDDDDDADDADDGGDV